VFPLSQESQLRVRWALRVQKRRAKRPLLSSWERAEKTSRVHEVKREQSRKASVTAQMSRRAARRSGGSRRLWCGLLSWGGDKRDQSSFLACGFVPVVSLLPVDLESLPLPEDFSDEERLPFDLP